MADFALELPDARQIQAMLRTKIEDNESRDAVIARFREHLDGRNRVVVPKSMQYKAVVSRGYHLNAFLNEKVSRYRLTPEYKFTPFSDSKAARDEADTLERAANQMVANLELLHGNRAWRSVVEDVLLLDAGVERIERMPHVIWPDLVVGDDGKDRLMRLYGDAKSYNAQKDKYLKQTGVPIRRTWVPLERFYPVFEGDVMAECFELEERSLRSVLANPLFDTAMIGAYDTGRDGGLKQKVVVMHYCNQQYHAYFALGPATSDRRWPELRSVNDMAKGVPHLLHAYRHGLGRPLYNYIAGRGGGWRFGASHSEHNMKALLELSQQDDEIRSQIATYLRSVLWPTRAMKYDPAARGGDDALPVAPKVDEGETIAMWNTESLENITQQIPDFRLAEWFDGTIERRMSELAGAPALFGQHQPGVDTGYHQQLQLTAAEHLDAQVEAALAVGATNGLVIAFEHIKAMGEKVYVHLPSKNARGQALARYAAIDPAKLDPMPMIEAKVRDPRPSDFITGMQTFIQATTIRPGHNSPALDDDMAREMFLGITSNAGVNRRILEQSYREQLLQGPYITQVLGQRLGLALAKAEGAAMTPEQAQMVPQSITAGAQQMVQGGETAQQGGVAPGTATALSMTPGAQQASQAMPTDGAAGLLNGRGGGIAPGNPQPAQTQGRAQQLLRAIARPVQ